MHRLLFFYFIFLISISCFTQNVNRFSFRSLDVDQGLSQNSVVSIAQDTTGYMWFATQDGLNKYDGKTFTYYNKQFEDVTESNYSKLGKLFVDDHSDLWIISNSGILEKFDKSEETFKSINAIESASVIQQDKNNNIYIGTYGKGLYKIDALSKDTVRVFENRLKNLNIYDIINVDKSCFLATSNHVFKLDHDTLFEVDVPIKECNYSRLALSKNKTIWLGSYGKGLYYKTQSADSFKPFKHENLPATLNIQDLLVDSNDNLWIATYGNGLYVINMHNNVWHFTEKQSDPFAIQYNDILSLHEDITGVIWIGNDGAGLNYYDKNLTKFNVLTNNQTPKDVIVDVVRSITKTEDNTMYLGTSGKGLTHINIEKNIYKTFHTENSSLTSNRIMSLLYDDKELWIGHRGGGLQVLKANGSFNTIEALKNKSISKIYKHQPNQYWLCTRENGIILFDKHKGIISSYNKDNSNLVSNDIRIIEKGVRNAIWIGSEDQGLFVLDTKTKKIKAIPEIKDKIKSLYFDGNILWVGTNGKGLKAYNILNKSVTSYNEKDGLPNQVIYGILPDENNNLWLSSNKGIFKFSLKDNKPKIRAYGGYNGLQAFEFNTGAYFKADDGTLYFGGIEGVNWFKPEHITINTVKPKTVISDVKLFNVSQPLKQNRSYAHNENTLTFTFAGLHFSQPEHNQYKYRLVNYDKDWVDTKNNNTAHYTNLAPKTYTFEVISSNYDGVWNQKPATYSFIILKPWYQTNLAKTIYVILTLLFLYGIYKYLEFRWKVKTRLQLEQAETERLKNLDEFKTKFFTNISHEFRTPLTLITGPVDQQLSKKTLKQDDRKALELVKQNTNRLLTLVNQMLDLSLLDSGQLSLKVIEGDLGILFTQIIEAFQYKAQEKKLLITSHIENLAKAWYDPDCIEKIITNLIGNAIKYSPKDSKIFVDANALNNNLVLSVTNYNHSISKKDFENIFERFYQNNEASEGVGVGLALVKELVTLSKGTIIASTLDDHQVQFTVTLPIHKSAFKSLEFKDQTVDITKTSSLKIAKTLKTETPVLLIVEDNEDIRAFVNSIFKASYTIIEANNGEQGIELAMQHIPDIIISDVMMPVKTGIELCNVLKYNELTSHVPIILLTAKVGETHEIEGLKTGADAYITKPFNSEKLQLRVEKLIENRKQLQKYFSKGFVVNPDLPIMSTETDFLKRLKLALDENITNSDFSSEVFSKVMHMSRTQLHRKLKAVVGMSATEFIRGERLKLAINLLEKSDASISEIAYQVGFNTPSYFIKCFKDIYNCTPTEYISKT